MFSQPRFFLDGFGREVSQEKRPVVSRTSSRVSNRMSAGCTGAAVSSSAASRIQPAAPTVPPKRARLTTFSYFDQECFAMGPASSPCFAQPRPHYPRLYAAFRLTSMSARRPAGCLAGTECLYLLTTRFGGEVAQVELDTLVGRIDQPFAGSAKEKSV